MKITFISDYLPYPPNNGVALPLFYLVKGLSKLHDVHYLYLDVEGQRPIDDNLLAENAKLIDIERVTIKRKSKFRRVINEALLTEPYFHGYDLRNVKVSSKTYSADVYFFNPFTALGFTLSKTLNKNAIRAAWINDSITAMMRSRLNYLHMKNIPINKKLLFLSQWIRSLYMGKLESAALARHDLIFVQTTTERRWIENISQGKLNSRTHVVSNGVNDVLFKMFATDIKLNFLFFGDMSGIYNELVIWLLKNVWVILRESVPNSCFHLIGKNASANVLDIVKNDSRIHYQSYVQNIEDVFSEKGVMLAPVFKNFGIINKVLESMAAGIPVVGDRTAFNGINKFKNGTHGIIANTAAEMAENAKLLLVNTDLYNKISIHGKMLMQDNFSWESRISSVDKSLRRIKNYNQNRLL